MYRNCASVAPQETYHRRVRSCQALGKKLELAQQVDLVLLVLLVGLAAQGLQVQATSRLVGHYQHNTTKITILNTIRTAEPFYCPSSLLEVERITEYKMKLAADSMHGLLSITTSHADPS